jgi:DNA-binding transcriptional MerR regulator
MKVDERTWSIGEIAAEFGLETHVLRHWEDAGVLRPERAANGWRVYRARDRAAIIAVLRGKQAGLSLRDIAAMFDADRASRHELLAERLKNLDRRLVEIKQARELVAHVMRCQAEVVTECPHFQRLTHEQGHGVAPESVSQG